MLQFAVGAKRGASALGVSYDVRLPDGRDAVMLALADAFVVTGDSVNMVCEAATTGKPVHVVDLKGGSAKFARFHESLRAAGITRPFQGRLERWSYAALRLS